MRTDIRRIAFAYLRLSNEEAAEGESSSIKNQRMIIQDYCERNEILLVRVFIDDGWSGGNFDRPAFQEMIALLEQGKANIVITKDLSRLGRDMREASYYAEQYFPEHGIRYLTVADNFDTEQENVMAPFQFAMNEVYLRDGSRKVKEVLKAKREKGLYCACAPYGYVKDPRNKNWLVPDEETAPIIRRVFEAAANGDSSRKIAMDLNSDGIMPPLKYKVLYKGNFSEGGAARASDLWNYTTVKRILKNPVYLGHTLLGKSKKVSVKSKKKLNVPKDQWAVTENTHEPIITQEVFDLAQFNLGKGAFDFRQYDHVRRSIFSGIAFCAQCGHALCSCGTVYKGEREKYWYLSCNRHRLDITAPCVGVRIKYSDILEVVRQDLNSLISLSPEEKEAVAREAMRRAGDDNLIRVKQLQLQKAKARLSTIDKVITKLYTDNAEGKIDDSRLERMLSELQRESAGLEKTIDSLSVIDSVNETQESYRAFFELANKYTHIKELDRDTLVTFVRRIEVGPKELPEGAQKATHRNQPFRQSVRIFYKFIGELESSPVREFPAVTDL
ncbi:recombinase family protein [Lawsonibacter sp. LCP25S3_G6]|uniref:recombinase family protein n=1 Tax=unclassified Lawsonibacter TaxID=2617946 RepID=UPI003F945275